MLYINLCLLCLLNVIAFSNAIAPPIIAAGVGAIATGLGVVYNYAKCYKDECCDDKWIKFDAEGLKSDFQQKVFGQHVVQRTVIRALKAHFKRGKGPKKALVMSFHGWTGSGKNLVSSLIAANLYHQGPQSVFYKLYLGSRDFAHKEEVNKYRQSLRSDIEAATAFCQQNLFVFDEVDKMAPGVLDAVSPYVDYHESISGVDYRNNIFIFLSNAGGSNITRVALNFWSEGKEREEIQLKDIERLVTLSAFNEKGGLQNSDIVQKDLVDAFVPFLPLEKRHVRQCIVSEIKAQNRTVDYAIVDQVANQLIYLPPDTNLFSASGCKKVSTKLNLLFQDDDDDDEDDDL